MVNESDYDQSMKRTVSLSSSLSKTMEPKETAKRMIPLQSKASSTMFDSYPSSIIILLTILLQFANRKIIFFDAGQYVLTDTITIPPGSRLVGEAWTVIGGSGPKFQDKQYPRPIVRVGKEGSTGIAEITDIVFTTYGPGKWR